MDMILFFFFYFNLCNLYLSLNSSEDTESSVSWSAKEPVDMAKNPRNLSSSRPDNLPSNSFKIGNTVHDVILNYFVL